MRKKKVIERMLFDMYHNIGMDKPHNHQELLDYIYHDVDETANPNRWHSGDVVIAFRRWIESKAENQP